MVDFKFLSGIFWFFFLRIWISLWRNDTCSWRMYRARETNSFVGFYQCHQCVTNDRGSIFGRLSPWGEKANKSVQFYGQSIKWRLSFQRHLWTGLSKEWNFGKRIIPYMLFQTVNVNFTEVNVKKERSNRIKELLDFNGSLIVLPLDIYFLCHKNSFSCCELV